MWVRNCAKVAAILMLLINSAGASAQVIFQRETLIISPPPLTQAKNADTVEKSNAKVATETPREPQNFLVEVRGEEALNLEYIHTLNDLTGNTGVMIAFSVPSIVSVPTMKVYSAVDVLFIDEDGIIVQILPDIVPAEINRDIAAPNAVSAFLYLKAGESEQRDIRPKDVVTHGLFNTKPLILK